MGRCATHSCGSAIYGTSSHTHTHTSLLSPQRQDKARPSEGAAAAAAAAEIMRTGMQGGSSLTEPGVNIGGEHVPKLQRGPLIDNFLWFLLRALFGCAVAFFPSLLRVVGGQLGFFLASKLYSRSAVKGIVIYFALFMPSYFWFEESWPGRVKRQSMRRYDMRVPRETLPSFSWWAHNLSHNQTSFKPSIQYRSRQNLKLQKVVPNSY